MIKTPNRIRLYFCKLISLGTAITFLTTNVMAAGSFSSISPSFSNSAQPNPSLINQFMIPEFVGQIKHSFQGSNDKFVVHIQDAHINEEAQRNIANILETLNAQYGLKWVALEGSEGELDADLYSFVPDQEARRLASDYYLKNGRLTGPEYLAIVNKPDLKLYGVEDRVLYEENRQAYLDALKVKNTDEEILAKLDKVLQDLSRYVFPESIRELNRRKKSLQDSGQDLAGYVHYLSKLAKQMNVDLENYKGMHSLLNLMNLESQIDFEQANAQVDALTEDLKTRLDRENLSKFLTLTVQWRLKQMPDHRFQEYLLETVKEIEAQNPLADLNTKHANALKYLEYQKLYQRVNVEIFDELDLLEQAIKSKVLSKKSEIELDQLIRVHSIYQKLFEFTLTKQDVDFFYAHRNQFNSRTFESILTPLLTQYHFNVSLPSNFDVLDEHLPLVEKFYQLALKRDQGLIQKTLEKIHHENAPIIALVTGGFHTPGIEKELQKQGYSYVVVSPRIASGIDKKNEERLYQEAMSQKPLPLQEKLADLAAPQNQGALNDPRFQLISWRLIEKAGIVNSEARTLVQLQALLALIQSSKPGLAAQYLMSQAKKTLGDSSQVFDFLAPFQRSVSEKTDSSRILWVPSQEAHVYRRFVLQNTSSRSEVKRIAGDKEVQIAPNQQLLISIVSDHLVSAKIVDAVSQQRSELRNTPEDDDFFPFRKDQEIDASESGNEKILTDNYEAIKFKDDEDEVEKEKEERISSASQLIENAFKKKFSGKTTRQMLRKWEIEMTEENAKYYDNLNDPDRQQTRRVYMIKGINDKDETIRVIILKVKDEVFIWRLLVKEESSMTSRIDSLFLPKLFLKEKFDLNAQFHNRDLKPGSLIQVEAEWLETTDKKNAYAWKDINPDYSPSAKDKPIEYVVREYSFVAGNNFFDLTVSPTGIQSISSQNLEVLTRWIERLKRTRPELYREHFQIFEGKKTSFVPRVERSLKSEGIQTFVLSSPDVPKGKNIWFVMQPRPADATSDSSIFELRTVKGKDVVYDVAVLINNKTPIFPKFVPSDKEGEGDLVSLRDEDETDIHSEPLLTGQSASSSTSKIIPGTAETKIQDERSASEPVIPPAASKSTLAPDKSIFEPGPNASVGVPQTLPTQPLQEKQSDVPAEVASESIALETPKIEKSEMSAAVETIRGVAESAGSAAGIGLGAAAAQIFAKKAKAAREEKKSQRISELVVAAKAQVETIFKRAQNEIAQLNEKYEDELKSLTDPRQINQREIEVNTETEAIAQRNMAEVQAVLDSYKVEGFENALKELEDFVAELTRKLESGQELSETTVQTVQSVELPELPIEPSVIAPEITSVAPQKVEWTGPETQIVGLKSPFRWKSLPDVASVWGPELAFQTSTEDVRQQMQQQEDERRADLIKKLEEISAQVATAQTRERLRDLTEEGSELFAIHSGSLWKEAQGVMVQAIDRYRQIVQAEYAELDQKLSNKQELIQRAQDKLNEFDLLLSNRQQSLDVLTTDIEGLENSKSQLQTEVERMDLQVAEVSKTQERVNQLKAQEQELNDSMAKLEQKKKTLSSEVEELKAKNDDLLRAIASQTQDLNGLDNRLKSLKEEYEAQKEIRGETEVQRQTLAKIREDVARETKEFEDLKSRIAVESSQLQSELQKLKTAVEETQAQVDEARIELDDLRQNIASERAEFERLFRQNEILREENQRMDESVANQRSILEGLQGLEQEFNRKIEILQRQVAELERRSQDEIRKNFEQQKADLEQAKQELASLQIQVANAKTTLADLKTAHGDVLNQITASQAVLASLDKQSQNLAEQIKKQETRLAEIQTAVSKAKRAELEQEALLQEEANKKLAQQQAVQRARDIKTETEEKRKEAEMDEMWRQRKSDLEVEKLEKQEELQDRLDESWSQWTGKIKSALIEYFRPASQKEAVEQPAHLAPNKNRQLETALVAFEEGLRELDERDYSSSIEKFQALKKEQSRLAQDKAENEVRQAAFDPAEQALRDHVEADWKKARNEREKQREKALREGFEALASKIEVDQIKADREMLLFVQRMETLDELESFQERTPLWVDRETERQVREKNRLIEIATKKADGLPIVDEQKEQEVLAQIQSDRERKAAIQQARFELEEQLEVRREKIRQKQAEKIRQVQAYERVKALKRSLWGEELPVQMLDSSELSYDQVADAREEPEWSVWAENIFRAIQDDLQSQVASEPQVGAPKGEDQIKVFKVSLEENQRAVIDSIIALSNPLVNRGKVSIDLIQDRLEAFRQETAKQFNGLPEGAQVHGLVAEMKIIEQILRKSTNRDELMKRTNELMSQIAELKKQINGRSELRSNFEDDDLMQAFEEMGTAIDEAERLYTSIQLQNQQGIAEDAIYAWYDVVDAKLKELEQASSPSELKRLRDDLGTVLKSRTVERDQILNSEAVSLLKDEKEDKLTDPEIINLLKSLNDDLKSRMKNITANAPVLAQQTSLRERSQRPDISSSQQLGAQTDLLNQQLQTKELEIQLRDQTIHELVQLLIQNGKEFQTKLEERDTDKTRIQRIHEQQVSFLTSELQDLEAKSAVQIKKLEDRLAKRKLATKRLLDRVKLSVGQAIQERDQQSQKLSQELRDELKAQAVEIQASKDLIRDLQLGKETMQQQLATLQGSESERVKQLEADLGRIDAHLKKANQQLRDSQKAYQNLEKGYTDLKIKAAEQFADDKEQIANLNALIAGLIQERDRLIGDSIAERDRLNQQIKERIKQLVSYAKRMQDIRFGLHQELADSKEKEADLRAQLEQFEADKDSGRVSEIADLKAQIEKLESEKEQLETQVSEANQAVLEVESQLNDLSAQAQLEIDQLKGDLNDAQIFRENAEGKLSAAEKDLEVAGVQLKALQAQLDQANQDLSTEQSARIAEVAVVSKQYSEETSKLNQKIQELEETINDLKDNTHRIDNETIAHLKEQLRAATEEKNRVEAELKERIAALERNDAAKLAEINRLKNAAQEIHQQLDKAQKEGLLAMQQLMGQKQGLETQLAAESEKSKKYQARIAVLHGRVSKFARAANELEKQRQEIKQDLLNLSDHATMAEKAFEEKITKLQTEIDQLKQVPIETIEPELAVIPEEKAEVPAEVQPASTTETQLPSHLVMELKFEHLELVENYLREMDAFLSQFDNARERTSGDLKKLFEDFEVKRVTQESEIFRALADYPQSKELREAILQLARNKVFEAQQQNLPEPIHARLAMLDPQIGNHEVYAQRWISAVGLVAHYLTVTNVKIDEISDESEIIQTMANMLTRLDRQPQLVQEQIKSYSDLYGDFVTKGRHEKHPYAQIRKLLARGLERKEAFKDLYSAIRNELNLDEFALQKKITAGWTEVSSFSMAEVIEISGGRTSVYQDEALQRENASQIEDAVILKPGLPVLGVFDGVGGYFGGAIVSSILALVAEEKFTRERIQQTGGDEDKIHELFLDFLNTARPRVNEKFEAIKQEIQKQEILGGEYLQRIESILREKALMKEGEIRGLITYTQGDPLDLVSALSREMKKAASTMTVSIVVGNKIYTYGEGDSPAYLARQNGEVFRLNRLHSASDRVEQAFEQENEESRKRMIFHIFATMPPALREKYSKGGVDEFDEELQRILPAYREIIQNQETAIADALRASGKGEASLADFLTEVLKRSKEPKRDYTDRENHLLYALALQVIYRLFRPSETEGFSLDFDENFTVFPLNAGERVKIRIMSDGASDNFIMPKEDDIAVAEMTVKAATPGESAPAAKKGWFSWGQKPAKPLDETRRGPIAQISSSVQAVSVETKKPVKTEKIIPDFPTYEMEITDEKVLLMKRWIVAVAETQRSLVQKKLRDALTGETEVEYSHNDLAFFKSIFQDAAKYAPIRSFLFDNAVIGEMRDIKGAYSDLFFEMNQDLQGFEKMMQVLDAGLQKEILAATVSAETPAVTVEQDQARVETIEQKPEPVVEMPVAVEPVQEPVAPVAEEPIETFNLEDKQIGMILGYINLVSVEASHADKDRAYRLATQILMGRETVDFHPQVVTRYFEARPRMNSGFPIEIALEGIFATYGANNIADLRANILPVLVKFVQDDARNAELKAYTEQISQAKDWANIPLIPESFQIQSEPSQPRETTEMPAEKPVKVNEQGLTPEEVRWISAVAAIVSAPNSGINYDSNKKTVTVHTNALNHAKEILGNRDAEARLTPEDARAYLKVVYDYMNRPKDERHWQPQHRMFQAISMQLPNAYTKSEPTLQGDDIFAQMPQNMNGVDRMNQEIFNEIWGAVFKLHEMPKDQMGKILDEKQARLYQIADYDGYEKRFVAAVVRSLEKDQKGAVAILRNVDETPDVTGQMIKRYEKERNYYTKAKTEEAKQKTAFYQARMPLLQYANQNEKFYLMIMNELGINPVRWNRLLDSTAAADTGLFGRMFGRDAKRSEIRGVAPAMVDALKAAADSTTQMRFDAMLGQILSSREAMTKLGVRLPADNARDHGLVVLNFDGKETAIDFVADVHKQILGLSEGVRLVVVKDLTVSNKVWSDLKESELGTSSRIDFVDNIVNMGSFVKSKAVELGIPYDLITQVAGIKGLKSRQIESVMLAVVEKLSEGTVLVLNAGEEKITTGIQMLMLNELLSRVQSELQAQKLITKSA